MDIHYSDNKYPYVELMISIIQFMYINNSDLSMDIQLWVSLIEITDIKKSNYGYPLFR